MSYVTKQSKSIMIVYLFVELVIKIWASILLTFL
jgi:hypothetical protein